MAAVSGRLGRALFGSAATISDANHSTGTVTIDFTGAHGLNQYELVYIEDVVGMTDINGTFEVITAPDTDTITITKTTAQSYTSGGSARKTIDVISLSTDITCEVIKTTSSSTSGGFDTYIPAGFATATGTISGLFIEGADLLDVNEEITAEFRISDTQYYSGSGVVTSINVGSNVPGTDAVTVSVGVQLTGEVSFT